MVKPKYNVGQTVEASALSQGEGSNLVIVSRIFHKVEQEYNGKRWKTERNDILYDTKYHWGLYHQFKEDELKPSKIQLNKEAYEPSMGHIITAKDGVSYLLTGQAGSPLAPFWFFIARPLNLNTIKDSDYIKFDCAFKFPANIEGKLEKLSVPEIDHIYSLLNSKGIDCFKQIPNIDLSIV